MSFFASALESLFYRFVLCSGVPARGRFYGAKPSQARIRGAVDATD